MLQGLQCLVSELAVEWLQWKKKRKLASDLVIFPIVTDLNNVMFFSNREFITTLLYIIEWRFTLPTLGDSDRRIHLIPQ